MENKYFTPHISDFYFGYEFEYQAPDKKWHKCTYHTNDKDKLNFVYIGPASLQSLIDREQIRVPYLTKEQLEAEGWELIQIYPSEACIFQKGTKEEGCELTYDFTQHRIHFTKLYFYGLDDEYTRTKLTWNSLECKDINTFKKIIKLLGI